jgi:hypothetical protein
VNSSQERAAIQQDIRAMLSSSRSDAVDTIARAMHALGRWTPEAEAAYIATCERLKMPPVRARAEEARSVEPGFTSEPAYDLGYVTARMNVPTEEES